MTTHQEISKYDQQALQIKQWFLKIYNAYKIVRITAPDSSTFIVRISRTKWRTPSLQKCVEQHYGVHTFTLYDVTKKKEIPSLALWFPVSKLCISNNLSIIINPQSTAQPSPTCAQPSPTCAHFPNEIDLSKISYSELKQSRNGLARTCYISYNGGKLAIETPWLSSSFGIRQPPPEYRDERAPPKYTIDFNLNGYRGEDEAVKKMYDFLLSLQNKLIEDTMVRKAIAECLFTPIVKFSKDKNTGEPTDMYPPTIKAKAQCWEGEWKCQAMRKGTGELIDGDLSEHVSGRINGRAIIECSSLWFLGGKFGTTWNLKMIEYEHIRTNVLTLY